MIIEIISSSTIKIVLDQDDMAIYNIDFDKLDRSNPETKRLLIDLIDIIKFEKDVDLAEKKLFVEAFPKDDGGCLLYLSMLEQNINYSNNKGSLYNTIICKITSPSVLLKLSSKLFTLFNHILHNSELYYYDGIYILILHTFKRADKKVKTLLTEFCDITGSGETDASTIREYYNCIYPLNAIEELKNKSDNL